MSVSRSSSEEKLKTLYNGTNKVVEEENSTTTTHKNQHNIGPSREMNRNIAISDGDTTTNERMALKHHNDTDVHKIIPIEIPPPKQQEQQQQEQEQQQPQQQQQQSATITPATIIIGYENENQLSPDIQKDEKKKI